MSLFSEQEQAMVSEALQYYLQVAQKQYSQEDVGQIVELAKGVIEKMASATEGGAEEAATSGPKGIKDEWVDNCCKKCDNLMPGGKCSDAITEKYPGKCDPILLYERRKTAV